MTFSIVSKYFKAAYGFIPDTSQMTFEGNPWRFSSFTADIVLVLSLTIFIKILGWSGS
jgi:hypothetical protein